MSRKDDLILSMREMAGTPSEMAAALNIEASDATFRRALKDLEDEGVLVPEGQTRDRSYRNANGQAPPKPKRAPRRSSPRKARVCPVCQRRSFGDGKWTCPEHGKGEDQPDRLYFRQRPNAAARPTPDEFASMAAVAGEGGRTIGARPKVKS